jgi:hypothetical protein
MELKQIDFSASEFMANGTRYLVKTNLSVERFKWFEKYQVYFGFGRDFKGIYDQLVKSVAFADKGKGLEAWNIIFNLKEEIGKNLDNRSHTAMYICALFIVTEDEDLTKWDEQMAQKKIDDWNAEGYDVNSFFRLAANLVNGFIDILEEVFQDISDKAAVLTSQKDSTEEPLT